MTQTLHFVYTVEGSSRSIARHALTQGDSGLEFSKIDAFNTGKAPSIIRVVPERNVLYAIIGLGPNAEVASYHIDRATGALSPGKSCAVMPGVCYIHVHPDSAYLFVSSYNNGGVQVVKLDDAGDPLTASEPIQEAGMIYSHSSQTSRDGRFLYVPHVKEHNALLLYAFTPEASPPLTPLDPLRVEIPDPLGPRHMVVHPEQPWYYSSNEQGLGIAFYRGNPETGQLTLGSVPEFELPEPSGRPLRGATAATVLIRPQGDFIYSFLRRWGADRDLILIWKIGESGMAAFAGFQWTDPVPWSGDISSDGRFLFSNSFREGLLNAWEIDDSDGSLTHLGMVEIGDQNRGVATVSAR